MYFFLRGIPFIYQGQELGMTNTRMEKIEDYDDISTKNHYRVALRDGLTPEEAFHGVSRYSRDNARVPFPWTTGENGGFSTATPWLKCHPDYKDFAAEKLMADKDSMFYWYKNMIDLRKQYGDILVEGSFAALDFGVEKSVCYSRTSEKGRIVSLNSFSGDITKYECGEGEIINGDGIVSFENGVVSLEPFGCALILMK
jgi:glycosidase